jgi:glycosyltransferase involved in cell wall biosynthesis
MESGSLALKDNCSEHHWESGLAPVAVVMITLNEGHNLQAVLDNMRGWAQEVFLVDSYSVDNTIDIALANGVHVVQRKFRGFGDQWNFALDCLPIRAPWVMKLDPDERLSDELKADLVAVMQRGNCDGISMVRRLCFMGRRLPILQSLTRVWRTGRCRFTDVSVNEHPIVEGSIKHIQAEIEHHDSPDLHHWLEKQNRYTTAEAIIAFQKSQLADHPRLFGSSFQRRMWLKKNFFLIPFRYQLLFIYYWLFQGAFRVGWVGYVWACLRSDVMRLIEYKRREIEITGRLPGKYLSGPGQADLRVQQYD